MTFSDCTADLVGQLNGNGQKGMLQIDAPPVENFWLRDCSQYCVVSVGNDLENETFARRLRTLGGRPGMDVWKRAQVSQQMSFWS